MSFKTRTGAGWGWFMEYGLGRVFFFLVCGVFLGSSSGLIQALQFPIFGLRGGERKLGEKREK